MTRSLIVTSDDFGLSPEVNEAVETAHRDGILTAASLMVGAPALADAVARARRLPELRIGLHLTLTDGEPVLPPERISALVQTDGTFRNDMAGLGVTLAASAAARQQLAAEIAAQIAAFRATGLSCDHVNAHKHFHLHPVIAATLFRQAAAAGIPAARVPWEPPALIHRIDPAAPTAAARALRPWTALVRALARRHGLATPDRVVGLAWSGRFTAEKLAAVLPQLPPGSTEVYLHPATAGGFRWAAPGYRYAEELAALIAEPVRRAVEAGGFRRIGYAGLQA